MSLSNSPLLIVIIIAAAIVLLLVVLWLINENRKKQYYEEAMRYILAPERAPVRLVWEPISDPDTDGFLTSHTTMDLEGLSDQVQLALKSKDRAMLQQFIEDVKFRFSPLYTPPPGNLFGRPMKPAGPAAPGDIPLDEHDVLLDFDMQGRAGKRDRKNEDPGKPYYAVAFNIDPTITRTHALGACPTNYCPCNTRNWFSTNQVNITVTVYASEGSVGASLGSPLVVGTGGQQTLSLYNPGGYRRYLSVGGRNLNKNTYRLTGTWNVW